jgi:hypothetical protein
VPPIDAYSPGEWAEFEEFAASGARVVETGIKPWPDKSATSDFYVVAGGEDDDELFAIEYLFPRREPLGEWDEAAPVEGVWLVYFTALQNPSRSAQRLWDDVERSSYEVDGYGVAMSPAYLFHGTGEAAEDFAAALRTSSLDWLGGDSDNSDKVVANDAYREHDDFEYVRVYDDGGPEDMVCDDGKVVVLRDTVFGWWWTMLQEEGTDPLATDGPYETEQEADRRARGWAQQVDDRRSSERGMDANDVYMNRQPEPDQGPPRHGIETENDIEGLVAIVYQP